MEHISMAIVNYTNEINGVSVETRQKNNDKCFDFAIKKLKEHEFTCKNCNHIDVLFCNLKQINVVRNDYCEDFEITS